jgi:hypothetical protein
VFDRQEEVGGKCQAWYNEEYVLATYPHIGRR